MRKKICLATLLFVIAAAVLAPALAALADRSQDGDRTGAAVSKSVATTDRPAAPWWQLGSEAFPDEVAMLLIGSVLFGIASAVRRTS
jgi:hypothetical protein